MENDIPPAAAAHQPPAPPLVTAGPPPLLGPPPPRRPQRRGRGWMIVAIILAVLLGVSLLSNFRYFANALSISGTAGRHAHRWLEEVTLEHHRSKNKIVVVDVSGIITSSPWDRRGSSMVNLIENQLELAGEDGSVKAVILRVDSPGGEVLASDEIYRTIEKFQMDHGKPVVASMGGVAASGGYYVSAPCQWIVANELTITGSIGVIMHTYNYRGLLNKVGVRPQVFKSGRFKDMLSGDKAEEEILPEERKMVQDLIDETFVRFKSIVREGRDFANRANGSAGRKLAANWEDFADGRVLSGKQAYESGFVDELGNFDTAVERAKELAEIENANLVRYQQPFDLSNLFRLFGETESRTVKIDLGMDLPRLEVGRLYFLSPTVLH